MDHKRMFEATVDAIKADIPGFSIGYKDENWISKLLGFLAKPFNPDYMTSFTTTRYPDVYFPSKSYVDEDWEKARAWKILAHEWVHLSDRKRRGVIFNLGYILPQVGASIAALALLAIWFSNWWLLALTGLVLLAPLPSPGRREAELRGYTMSMAVNFWRYASVSDDTKKWIAQQFTGPAYYFMWPFKANMAKRIDAAVKALETGEVFNWPNPEPFKRMKALIQEAS